MGAGFLHSTNGNPKYAVGLISETEPSCVLIYTDAGDTTTQQQQLLLLLLLLLLLMLLNLVPQKFCKRRTLFDSFEGGFPPFLPRPTHSSVKAPNG